MKRTLTYKGAVLGADCDSNRHMNVASYVQKFELAGRNFSFDIGLTELNKNNGIGLVALQQNIKYVKEVFEDDLVHIDSFLLDIGTKSFTIKHKMFNTKTRELIATMEVSLVLFDLDKRKALIFPTDKKASLLKSKFMARS